MNTYFWRTHQQQEVDLIEESGGKLYAWEFKWNEKAKAKIPQAFMDAYPDSIAAIMNRTNYMEFVNLYNTAKN